MVKRKTKSWFVYLLRCSDGTLYTGIAKDVEARAKVHNAGRGAKYTKIRRPVEVKYFEKVSGITKAMRREREIKKLPKLKKELLAGSIV